MTKDMALQAWLEQFAPAWADGCVPDNTPFPYLTWQFADGDFFGGPVNLRVDLWFRTAGEQLPNALAQNMAQAIGHAGVLLPCDGGFIWLRRGSPWCRSFTDDTDRAVKRRALNLTADYLTEN